MKTLYSRILTLVLLLSMLWSCAENLEIESDLFSDGQTVTLRIMLPDDNTKTGIEQSGKVVWTKGDVIFINGNEYEVFPDESDPGVAVVMNVAKADEYVARYSTVWEDESGSFSANIESYQCYTPDTSVLGEYNPMIGYSQTEELRMNNIGGILRLGLTGDVSVASITVTDNAGEYVTGYVLIPGEEVVSGQYSDTFEFAPETNGKYAILKWCNVTLSQNEPSYFHIVVAPKTFTEGFTVSISDAEGNMCIQSTSEPITVSRSKIVPMDAFAFTNVEAPKVTSVVADAAAVTFDVEAQSGSSLRVVAIPAAVVEASSDTLSLYSDALWSEASIETVVGYEGSCSIELNKAFYDIYTAPNVEMEPQTEYVILAAYTNHDRIGVNQKSENISVTTLAPYGDAPVINASLQSGTSWSELLLNIRVSEATSLKYALLPTDRYNYIIAGDSDIFESSDISATLEGSDLEAALSAEGYSSLASGLLPDLEYTLVVKALTQGAMQAQETFTCRTSQHLPSDAVWTPVQGDANVNMDLGCAFYEGPISLEISSDGAFYRFLSPFTVSDLQLDPEIYEITFDTEGQYYIYLDISRLSEHIMSMPPFESYLGYTITESGYEESSQLFLTNTYMEYVNVWEHIEYKELSFSVGMSYYRQSEGVFYNISHGNISLRIPVAYTSFDASSTEEFTVKDEVQWQ